MDYNNLLLFTLLPLGRYGVNNKKIHFKSLRIRVNYACAIIIIICGFETVVILIVSGSKTVLHLIELYIVGHKIQKELAFLPFATGMIIEKKEKTNLHFKNFETFFIKKRFYPHLLVIFK